MRIRRVGVCGSDLHAFRNTHPAYSFPRVLGHELGGDVVSINGGAAGVRAGDRCAIDAFLNCGTCRACRRGRRNCCEDLRFYGIHVDGGMQEFMTVPVGLLHASARLTHDQLALIEPLEGRRTLVEPLGVEVTAAPDGRVADVVIDATGRREVMERSVDHVAPGGRLVFLSVVPGRVSFDDWQFHRREMSILASRASLDAFPDIIRRIEAGRIDTTPWITGRMTLEEVPDRFEGLLTRANQMKVVVHIE